MEQESAEFILVRHGLTGWNAAGRIQGHTDTDLCDEGYEQARSVGRRLQEESYDLLFSSDLKRARQTAQPLADVLEMEIQLDDRLREWNLGAFEGLTVDEARERFADAYRKYRAFDPELRVPEGESFLEFDHRVIHFFQEMSQAHAGKRLLVFTHGGSVNVVLRHVLGIPTTSRDKFYIPNTSVTRVRVSPKNDGISWALIESDVDLLHPGINPSEPRGDV